MHCLRAIMSEELGARLAGGMRAREAATVETGKWRKETARPFPIRGRAARSVPSAGPGLLTVGPWPC